MIFQVYNVMLHNSNDERLHPHELSNIIQIIGRGNLLEAIYIYIGGFQHALLKDEEGFVDWRNFINIHELLNKEYKEPLDRYLNLQLSLQGLFLIYTKVYLILQKEKYLDTEKVIQKIYEVFICSDNHLAKRIAESLEKVILSQMSEDEKCQVVDIIKGYIFEIQAAQFGLNNHQGLFELLETKESLLYDRDDIDNDSLMREIIKTAIQRIRFKPVIIDFLVKTVEQETDIILFDKYKVQNSEKNINDNDIVKYHKTIRWCNDRFKEAIEQAITGINGIKLINILMNPKGQTLIQNSHDFEERILKNVRRLVVQNENFSIHDQELLLSQELIQFYCDIHNIKVNKELILLLTLNYEKDHYKELSKCIKNQRYLDIEMCALLFFMMISKDMFPISLTQSSNGIVYKFRDDYELYIFNICELNIITNKECIARFIAEREELINYFRNTSQNEKAFKLQVEKKIVIAVKMLDLSQHSLKYKISFSVFYGLILSASLYYYIAISNLSTLASSSENTDVKNIIIDLTVAIGIVIATAAFIYCMLPKKEKVNSCLNESESTPYEIDVEKETTSVTV